MYAVDIVFNNGKKLEALMWRWVPAEGWFEALNEKNGVVKKYSLKDVQSGLFYSDRIREKATSEDLLEKAQRDGFVK